MSKDGTVRPIADHGGSSPAAYPCSSQHNKLCESNNPVDSAENIREWEEARCPICMEHPHNAVTLICSSQEKGCRPYMCNTDHSLSNCLDQFNNGSPVPSPSIALPQEVPPSGTIEGQMISSSVVLFGSGVDSKLVCPFCRGKILGWDVSEAARQYMDSKPRSCSLETCEFTGTYSELRKHAQSEHPHLRPSEVDPSRQHDWTRLVEEIAIEDARSSLEPDIFGDEAYARHLFLAEIESQDQTSLFEDNWSFLLDLDQGQRQMQSRMTEQRTLLGIYGYESNGSVRRANPYFSPWGVDPSPQRYWPWLEPETEFESFWGRRTLWSAFLEDERSAGHLFMAENGSVDPMLLLEAVWSLNLSRPLSMAEIGNEFLSQSHDRGHRQMRSQMLAQRMPRGRYGYESNGGVRRANLSAMRCNGPRLRQRDYRWSASSNRR
ncbi:hypothetical protein BT93_J2070 [Corymbia citriodora subsp. variegata]|nr:hypothetical protein BT93_J2070 [Corymbia citriodora subsp. variegata]KAF8011674.1 hypothetical protein BT93_J2070 [Corymbia citriodora subsp. variegata]